MQIQDMSPLDGGNYWINGLLQGLVRSNLYLHRGGAPTLESHIRQLLPINEDTEETVRQLHRRGINTWADRPINSARDPHDGVRYMSGRNLHSAGGNGNSAAVSPAGTILAQN